VWFTADYIRNNGEENLTKYTSPIEMHLQIRQKKGRVVMRNVANKLDP